MARLSVVAALSLMLLMSACGSRSKEMKNAETYMQVNELGKAKELLDLEIQTNPKNAEAYVMLAKVFLLGGDPLDARAAFDKALLLDSSTKTEISKTYFEAAQGVVENKGDGASGLVSTYLQEAATLNPDLKGKIADWAIKRAKAEASANKTTAPIALLQAAAKAAPDSRDRISSASLDMANAYLEKQFLREAAAYAMEAGQQSASKLSEASSVLRRACTLLPTQDREYARGCLEKAVQWNPALANDDDVSWLTSVGLNADGGSGAADYLAKFPNGKHSGEAASMLMERRNAAEQAAKTRADLAYISRDCEGAEDGQPGSIYRDLSNQNIDRFTIDLHPGCFSGYILLPQSWEYYHMGATGPTENWWLAYKWYQSKNSGSGQNGPWQPNQLENARHGSHKIRVQGHGQLLFYPISATGQISAPPSQATPVATYTPDSNNGGFGGGAYRIGGGVSGPSVLSKVEPEYSEEARKAKWQGTVILQLVVNERGLPQQMKVVRSLGLGLDQKAIEAVAKWRFKPGMKDGKPVPVIATIEVNFRLL
jgi:TonB family protein